MAKMTDRYREYLEQKASQGDKTAMRQLGIEIEDGENDSENLKGMYFDNNCPAVSKKKPSGWHKKNEKTGFNNKSKTILPDYIFDGK